MTSPKVRDWFYYRARSATADTSAAREAGAESHRDRRRGEAGKSKEAIASAFEAALLDQ